MWKVWMLAALFFSACAQVGQLSGGEKDEAPPQLIRATPPNGTVNFTVTAFRLDFDERIQLERVRERLLISPPLDEPPEVRIVGARSVEVKIPGKLKANTTYSFNLGECVKDLTEGNLAAGLNYVISTGDVLDSLQVDGVVRNSLTDAPEKDMLVMLHAEGDTTSFRNGRPLYLTRSAADGSFTLTNLPAGRFAVFALRDKNGNFKYDLPNEEIAFLDSSVDLPSEDTAQSPQSLRAFLPRSAQQQIRSSSVLPDGALELVLAKPEDELNVRDIARTGGSLSWSFEWNATRDTVLLWPNDTTALADGEYVISEGSLVLDTLGYRRTKPMPFNTVITGTLIEEGDVAKIQLRATRPISKVDSSRFELVRDSVKLPYTIEERPSRGASEDERTLALITGLKAGESARLHLYPKAIRDIYGGVNDTVRISLGRAAEEATGTLRVKISGLDSSGNYVLQLLDAQQRVLRATSFNGGGPEVFWPRLAPNMVTLRLFADPNMNGQWDTGEWAEQRQPESAWNHAEPVNVRAAWDVVVDWTIK